MSLPFAMTLLTVMAISIPAGLGIAYAARNLSESTQPPVIVAIAASAAVGIWAACVMPTLLLLAISYVLGWTLLLLGLVDAFAFRLPDILTLPLLVAGVAVAWWLPEHDLFGHAVAALLGAGAFFAISAVYLKTRGQEGLGLGDAKLAGAAGAWLGWQALPYVVLLASFAGLLWVGIAVIRRGKEALSERIPFGVALCFAMWIAWLYGTPDFFGAM